MIFAPFPVVVLVLGLLIWALSSRSKEPGIFPTVGQWMFVCGLLALCFANLRNTVSIP